MKKALLAITAIAGAVGTVALISGTAMAAPANGTNQAVGQNTDAEQLRTRTREHQDTNTGDQAQAQQRNRDQSDCDGTGTGDGTMQRLRKHTNQS